MINALLLPHGSGTFLLAAPRRPEDSELVAGERVTHVLNILREQYHYIVLDLPHDFRETTLAGLDLAQEILTVMSADLASVLAMSSTQDVFETLNYPRDIIKLVLNQTFERNALGQKVMEDALKRRCNLVIPYTPEMVQANNVGKPMVLMAPTSPAGMVLEDYIYQISKEEHRKQRPEHPTLAWQRVMKRQAQKK
jgi:pilus assembly protein CpaE